jgi:hypothetical protein
MRPLRVSLVAALACAFAVPLAAGGCNALLGLSEYQLGVDSSVPANTDANRPPDGSTDEEVYAADASCIDPNGFGGVGCGTCPPTRNTELLNACTKAACSPFDNVARIAGFADGGRRPAPAFDAAPPGAPDASVDSGSPSSDASAPDAASGGGTGNVLCRTLSPRPVYLLGSTALYPRSLKTFAQAISGVATLVYMREASCNGLDAILTGDTKLRGTVSYWRTDTEAELKCDIDDERGRSADIGLCDAFPETCLAGFGGLPDFVGDFTGPVQVFMFTVPNGSSQKAISAEAAFSVFGFGPDSRVEPWVNPAFIFKRYEKSGTQLVIAASLGLPAPAWLGESVISSGQMKPRLVASIEPEKTIGITSADVADDFDSRTKLRTLAYKHYDQACGFLPDSVPGGYDKRNVRDGHYFMWAPVHFYARVRGGVIEDSLVRDVVNYLTFAKALPDRNTDVISALKAGGLVPRCAMTVARTKEGGPLEPFKPRPSCACAFEAASPSDNAPACKACGSDSDCSAEAPSCNFRFCEPR